MDLKLRRESERNDPVNIPIQFVINGARSEKIFQMTDQEFERLGLTIKIDAQVREGHGRVEIANDSNPEDNVFHFVFAEPPVQKTIIVSDDAQSAKLLGLATGTPADSTLDYKAEVIPSRRTDEIPWNETALVLWQAPLPEGLAAKQLENFVLSGRTVMFFPPEVANDNEIFGASWGTWMSSEDKEGLLVQPPWNDRADLLMNTQSDSPLPVGELKTFKYCELGGDQFSRLADFVGGIPLLARAPTDSGSVYFFSTLPRTEYSSLSGNPVMFYIMLQRALASGAGALGRARQMEAGGLGMEDLSRWTAADEASDAIISQRPFQRGAWKSPDDRLLAINRPLAEDTAPVMTEGKLDEIFGTLDYTQITDEITDSSSLINEIWRAFLIIMIIALVIEAILCLPERRVVSEAEAA